MTIPPQVRQPAIRLADMVRDVIPFMRNRLTEQDHDLGVYLRQNDALLGCIKAVIMARIGVRANQPVPSDPIQCKARLERDRELRELIAHLEFIHRSPVAESAESDGEQPA